MVHPMLVLWVVSCGVASGFGGMLPYSVGQPKCDWVKGTRCPSAKSQSTSLSSCCQDLCGGIRALAAFLQLFHEWVYECIQMLTFIQRCATIDEGPGA